MFGLIDERAQNLWIWFVGTLVVTMAWSMATFHTGLGMYSLVLLPALSFLVFRKTTSLFDTTDEERERMRQDALKNILKNLNKAHKTLWKMGYLNDLTDMSYQKDEWTDHERATIEVSLALISENLKRRKAQKPLKELHPEEIQYLVQQKRKEKEIDTFRMLKMEMEKRTKEIEMLEELMAAEKDDEPEADGIITEIEADIKKIKEIEEELEEIDEDIEEEEEDEGEDLEELEVLEKDIKALDEEIEEVENDEDYEPIPEFEELEAMDEPDEEPLIKTGLMYDKVEDAPIEEETTGFTEIKKPSLRDVLGKAMDKLKEDETDESKS